MASSTAPGDFLKQTSFVLEEVLEKGDERDFHRFCEMRISDRSNMLLGLCFFLITSYIYLMSVMGAPGTFISTLSAFGGLFLNPAFLLLIITRKTCPMALSERAPIVMNVVSVLISLNLGLFLIARVLRGKCQSLDIFHRWSCNSEYESHSLPQSSVLILMFMPLLFSVTIKTIRVSFVCISWLIVLISIVAAIVIGNSFVTIPVLIFYVPLSITCIYEIHRQNIFQFLMLKRQQSLIDTNKILTEESQNEMRFMIANMAHDLKTVSIQTAFHLSLVILNFLATFCFHEWCGIAFYYNKRFV